MERVTVTVSEPWDFATPVGSNTFAAEVHAGGDNGPLLLRLLEPVRWRDADWQWFVATRTTAAAFSLYGLTESQAANNEWHGVPDAWRGQSPLARAEVRG